MVKSFLIMLMLMLLAAGCSKEECPPERIINNSYYYNTTILEVREVEVEKIVEVEKACVKIKEYDSSYVSNLVQQIKRCERQLDDSLNLTVCTDDIYECLRDLNDSNTKLEELRELLE